MIGSKTDRHRESELKKMQVWGISGCQPGKDFLKTGEGLAC